MQNASPSSMQPQRVPVRIVAHGARVYQRAQVPSDSGASNRVSRVKARRTDIRSPRDCADAREPEVIGGGLEVTRSDVDATGTEAVVGGLEVTRSDVDATGTEVVVGGLGGPRSGGAGSSGREASAVAIMLIRDEQAAVKPSPSETQICCGV